VVSSAAHLSESYTISLVTSHFRVLLSCCVSRKRSITRICLHTHSSITWHRLLVSGSRIQDRSQTLVRISSHVSWTWWSKAPWLPVMYSTRVGQCGNSLVIGHSGSIGGTSAPRRRSTSVPADVQPRVESMRGRIRASRGQVTLTCYPLVCLWKRQTVDVQLSWRHLVPFRSCDCIRASDVRECVWILPKMRQINQCSLTRLITRATPPLHRGVVHESGCSVIECVK
jgi:hypothetical protein